MPTITIDRTRSTRERKAVITRFVALIATARGIAAQTGRAAKLRDAKHMRVRLTPCNRGTDGRDVPGVEIVAHDWHRGMIAHVAWVTLSSPITVDVAGARTIETAMKADGIVQILENKPDTLEPTAHLRTILEGRGAAAAPSVTQSRYLQTIASVAKALGPDAFIGLATRGLDMLGCRVTATSDAPTMTGDDVIVGTMPIRDPDVLDHPMLHCADAPQKSKPNAAAEAKQAAIDAANARANAAALDALRAQVAALDEEVADLQAKLAEARRDGELDARDAAAAEAREDAAALERGEARETLTACRLNGWPVTTRALLGDPATRSWEVDRVAAVLEGILPELAS